MSSLWQNTVFLRIFIIKIFILETSPLISLELLCYRLDRYPDLTQTRMGLGRVTFSSKGPMRGQYVFLMAKYINLYGRFIFPLSFPQTQPLISLKRVCLLVWLVSPTQARMGVGRVTFLSKGPMRGQYVFSTAKYVLFMEVF